MFREKVKLVHPISVHSHFGMRHLNYEERKERSTSIAERYTNFEIPYERKHDIADALCMIIYDNFKSTTHFFDRFKYMPKI